LRGSQDQRLAGYVGLITRTGPLTYQRTGPLTYQRTGPLTYQRRVTHFPSLDERSRREDPQYRGGAAAGGGGVEEWLARRQKRKAGSGYDGGSLASHALSASRTPTVIPPGVSEISPSQRFENLRFLTSQVGVPTTQMYGG